MAKKKKSCVVCGQKRCVKSKDCMTYEAGGMVDGQWVEIYTIPQKKPRKGQ